MNLTGTFIFSTFAKQFYLKLPPWRLSWTISWIEIIMILIFSSIFDNRHTCYYNTTFFFLLTESCIGNKNGRVSRLARIYDHIHGYINHSDRIRTLYQHLHRFIVNFNDVFHRLFDNRHTNVSETRNRNAGQCVQRCMDDCIASNEHTST